MKEDNIKKEAKTEKRMTPEEKAHAKEKVEKIIKKAKEKGKITYGELAVELDDVNQDQIEKVFDVMEEMGVDVLKDDFDDEPNEEDLKEEMHNINYRINNNIVSLNEKVENRLVMEDAYGNKVEILYAKNVWNIYM